jgi:hypothetical protein
MSWNMQYNTERRWQIGWQPTYKFDQRFHSSGGSADYNDIMSWHNATSSSAYASLVKINTSDKLKWSQQKSLLCSCIFPLEQLVWRLKSIARQCSMNRGVWHR